jgi:hypothetical protein
MSKDSHEAVQFSIQQMWTLIREQKDRLDRMEADLAMIKKQLAEHLSPRDSLVDGPNAS